MNNMEFDQNKYQEMQVLSYQLKQLQSIMDSIETQLKDVKNTIDALNGFKDLKEEDEVLFPLANGIFAKGKLTDNKSLSINIGSNIVVEKSIDDTIQMMNVQAEDMEKYKTEITSQLNKVTTKLESIQE
ncbi:MAG TPA: prefoldin subunit alpha [Alphaproteobacteria bacterium]|nr:prefoldin subunit alpha [Alphaproteobacteria bacterium]